VGTELELGNQKNHLLNVEGISIPDRNSIETLNKADQLINNSQDAL